MPFDGTLTETPALRRAILIDALRGKMPSGFYWNFATVYKPVPCGSEGCALGLASELWPQHAEMLRGSAYDFAAFGANALDERAIFLGLSRVDFMKIFFNTGPRGGALYHTDNVRPHHVANALERVTEFTA